jgi:protoporphyrinogen oxidase
VWGIDCTHISADWVAQRIQGMSLGQALREALFRTGRGARTLADRFLYPARGIGAIAEGLARKIEQGNRLLTGREVVQIRQRAGRIESIRARSSAGTELYRGQMFISSLPLPAFVTRLDPPPPARVRAAAAGLRYRDLVVVALLIDRERVTDQSWVYFPDPDIAIGRVHEPKNWSPRMAPAGATVLVAEHFCFREDALWRTTDSQLIDRTANELARLGLIKRSEVYDGRVVRVPHAYPVFEVGYDERCRVIGDYCAGFRNLHLIGRTGAFRYYNMDRAIESGLDAAHGALAGLDAPQTAFPRTGTDS